MAPEVRIAEKRLYGRDAHGRTVLVAAPGQPIPEGFDPDAEELQTIGSEAPAQDPSEEQPEQPEQPAEEPSEQPAEQPSEEQPAEQESPAEAAETTSRRGRRSRRK